MAHFAEIDGSNIVLRVIVINNAVLLDDNGVEQESLGRTFCHDLFGGNWIQTSYNGNIRYHYAGIGFHYDAVNDAFIAPQPYPSWSTDENFDWQAPVPIPDTDHFYYWDEDTLSWKRPD